MIKAIFFLMEPLPGTTISNSPLAKIDSIGFLFLQGSIQYSLISQVRDRTNVTYAVALSQLGAIFVPTTAAYIDSSCAVLRVPPHAHPAASVCNAPCAEVDSWTINLCNSTCKYIFT